MHYLSPKDDGRPSVLLESFVCLIQNPSGALSSLTLARNEVEWNIVAVYRAASEMQIISRCCHDFIIKGKNFSKRCCTYSKGDVLYTRPKEDKKMELSKYELYIIECALKSYASKFEEWIDHDIQVGDTKYAKLEALALTNIREITEKIIAEKETK